MKFSCLGYKDYTPNTISASIFSSLLMSRAIFSVGSLLPDRYSLTRDGLIPSISESFVWVKFISYIRSLITSTKEGGCMG